MAMSMSTNSLLEPQFFGSYALPSDAIVGKTETENGTTLNLNLKKAETESENGRFKVYTGWSLNPNRNNLLKAHGRIMRLRSSSRLICAMYMSNPYHFHGTVYCPGHPIVDKWRASRKKIQGLYNLDVVFI
jgi:hypothetical protein